LGLIFYSLDVYSSGNPVIYEIKDPIEEGAQGEIYISDDQRAFLKLDDEIQVEIVQLIAGLRHPQNFLSLNSVEMIPKDLHVVRMKSFPDILFVQNKTGHIFFYLKNPDHFFEAAPDQPLGGFIQCKEAPRPLRDPETRRFNKEGWDQKWKRGTLTVGTDQLPKYPLSLTHSHVPGRLFDIHSDIVRSQSLLAKFDEALAQNEDGRVRFMLQTIFGNSDFETSLVQTTPGQYSPFQEQILYRLSTYPSFLEAYRTERMDALALFKTLSREPRKKAVQELEQRLDLFYHTPAIAPVFRFLGDYYLEVGDFAALGRILALSLHWLPVQESKILFPLFSAFDRLKEKINPNHFYTAETENNERKIYLNSQWESKEIVQAPFRIFRSKNKETIQMVRNGDFIITLTAEQIATSIGKGDARHSFFRSLPVIMNGGWGVILDTFNPEREHPHDLYFVQFSDEFSPQPVSSLFLGSLPDFNKDWSVDAELLSYMGHVIVSTQAGAIFIVTEATQMKTPRVIRALTYPHYSQNVVEQTHLASFFYNARYLIINPVDSFQFYLIEPETAPYQLSEIPKADLLIDGKRSLWEQVTSQKSILAPSYQRKEGWFYLLSERAPRISSYLFERSSYLVTPRYLWLTKAQAFSETEDPNPINNSLGYYIVSSIKEFQHLNASILENLLWPESPLFKIFQIMSGRSSQNLSDLPLKDLLKKALKLHDKTHKNLDDFRMWLTRIRLYEPQLYYEGVLLLEELQFQGVIFNMLNFFGFQHGRLIDATEGKTPEALEETKRTLRSNAHDNELLMEEIPSELRGLRYGYQALSIRQKKVLELLESEMISEKFMTDEFRYFKEREKDVKFFQKSLEDRVSFWGKTGRRKYHLGFHFMNPHEKSPDAVSDVMFLLGHDVSLYLKNQCWILDPEIIMIDDTPLYLADFKCDDDEKKFHLTGLMRANGTSDEGGTETSFFYSNVGGKVRSSHETQSGSRYGYADELQIVGLIQDDQGDVVGEFELTDDDPFFQE